MLRSHQEREGLTESARSRKAGGLVFLSSEEGRLTIEVVFWIVFIVAIEVVVTSE